MAPVAEDLALSIPRAAARLDVSPNTVKRMVAAGELPAVRIRRRVMVPTKALAEWIEANTVSPQSVSGRSSGPHHGARSDSTTVARPDRTSRNADPGSDPSRKSA